MQSKVHRLNALKTITIELFSIVILIMTTISLGAKRLPLIYRGHYLVTIQRPQKTDYVPDTDLDEICNWLIRHRVRIHEKTYEAHGMYKQMHCHMRVFYHGEYKHLTKIGDNINFPEYTIRWTPISSFRKTIDYINKFPPLEKQQQFQEHYIKHHYVKVS